MRAVKVLGRYGQLRPAAFHYHGAWTSGAWCDERDLWRAETIRSRPRSRGDRSQLPPLKRAKGPSVPAQSTRIP